MANHTPQPHSYLPPLKTYALLCLGLSLGSALLLSQCTHSRPLAGPRVVMPTPTGAVTTQQMGDTTVMTRTLIHHQLTNADIGKTYQEITVVSPRGTSVQERVIVRALPRLETENRTKS